MSDQEKRIYGLKDLENQNVVLRLSKPVNLFTENRGTFSLFQRGKIVYCEFDFGWVGSDIDLRTLFSIDIETDKITLIFPKDKNDKRSKRIGLIKEFPRRVGHPLNGGPIVYRALVSNEKIVCLIPNGEGVKWLGDIYIHLIDHFVRVNLQLALFEVMPENERYLIFSYCGKSLKQAVYFLAIEEKTLFDPYRGIGFFLPKEH